jgi:NAD-dependent dihydropyrimidine dehydrogenase PreA subunit
LCNGCVDICPWDCLKIVSLKQIRSDETFVKAVEAQLGAPLEMFLNENELTVAAMLKDDEACTRCALCADRCPTDAITMETFRFKETLSYVE